VPQAADSSHGSTRRSADQWKYRKRSTTKLFCHIPDIALNYTLIGKAGLIMPVEIISDDLSGDHCTHYTEPGYRSVFSFEQSDSQYAWPACQSLLLQTGRTSRKSQPETGF